MANRWWPSVSISATMSLARVPVSYPPAGLSESPIPRWSTAMTWKSRASAGISMRQAYQVWGQPCTSSSGGPSPPMTACRRTSPVSTYWLVNVSVNPSGRFGAWETEPGPWGMAVEDELMRIPLLGLLVVGVSRERACAEMIEANCVAATAMAVLRKNLRRLRLFIAGLHLPQGPERRPNLAGEELGLLPR